MNRFRWIAPLVALCMLAGVDIAPAQMTPAPPQTAPAPLPAGAPMSQDLLDSLLAPIALYPDQLLSQVLMASTYPLEVVEAARFVKANPNLRGEALDRALQDKTWDPSVLSLCAFPQVLDMMDAKLDWTQRIGDAFLADEAAVMNTVQSLRLRAQQAGNLQSTPQQNVIVQERAIVIEPAQPEYVYVPVYNPEIIYGPWWAPAYRPWYWYPGPIWGYPAAPLSFGYAAGIYWGTAWAINAYNWGWCRPNWRGHNLYVDVHGRNPWVNRPYYRDRYANSPNWSHSPEHRRGVAYRDPGTAQRYRPANPGAVQAREGYRGRDFTNRQGYVGGDATSRPGYGGGDGRPGPGAGSGARPGQGAVANGTRPTPGERTRPATGATGVPGSPGGPGSVATTRPAPTQPTAPPAQTMTRPAPTTSPSFTRSAPAASYPQPAYRPESRVQVQRDATRGAQSRATMSQPAPQSMPSGAGGASRPSVPSAPVSGQHGGQGGGQAGTQSGGQGGGPSRQR